MDWIRTAYVTKMKLWRDSDEETLVRWFYAKPGAKIFDKPTAFYARHQWDNDRYDTIGESGYVRYDKGKNPGVTGEGHCGSDNAMSLGGIHGVDPEIDVPASGIPDCCPGEVVVLCDRVLPVRVRVVVTSDAGCVCASGTVFDLVYEGPFASGLHLWSMIDEHGNQRRQPWGACGGDGETIWSYARVLFDTIRCSWYSVFIQLTKDSEPATSQGRLSADLLVGGVGLNDLPITLSTQDDEEAFLTTFDSANFAVGACEIRRGTASHRAFVTIEG